MEKNLGDTANQKKFYIIKTLTQPEIDYWRNTGVVPDSTGAK